MPKRYPFHKLAVGQSFSVPEATNPGVRQAAYNYWKRHGAKFAVEVLVRRGVRRMRVERVA